MLGNRLPIPRCCRVEHLSASPPDVKPRTTAAVCPRSLAVEGNDHGLNPRNRPEPRSGREHRAGVTEGVRACLSSSTADLATCRQLLKLDEGITVRVLDDALVDGDAPHKIRRVLGQPAIPVLLIDLPGRLLVIHSRHRLLVIGVDLPAIQW